MTEFTLKNPITLPCGQTLHNRLCKAAMTERLAGPNHKANQRHISLYEAWANCGAGLLITGNIMIEKTHLESAGNIVLDQEESLPSLKKLVTTGLQHGNQFWAQISHSGRQTSILNNLRPKAPSSIQLKKMGLFGKPQALLESEILALIEKYVATAGLCKKAGFTGIQIHAAHGYLISQFLSPITNRRNDSWGGSLENRSRFLLTVVNRCRKLLGPDFAISVKLNSSDFQKGGFTEEESLKVVKMLEEYIDLLEVSGGNYEKMQFFDSSAKESTRKREAYFIDFANKVRNQSSVPLMITGGFRSRTAIQSALQNREVDVIGMARPFCLYPDKIALFIEGQVEELHCPKVSSWFKPLDFSAEGGYYAKQIIRLARGKRPLANYGGFSGANFLLMHEMVKATRNIVNI